MTKTVDTGEPRIELVDPALCLATDNANPAEREDIDFLMASLEESPQRVPVLLAHHDAPPHRYRYLDGHGRGFCLGKLGRMMQAIILAGEVSDSQLIEIKFQSNVLRRSLSLVEIAADTRRYMDLTGCKQKEAASRLRCSETTISRALALVNRIPEQCRTAVCEMGPHFVSLVSTLRGDVEQIQDVIGFARTPTFEGKKPSREAITEHVAELRGKVPPGGGKVKRLRFAVDGRAFEVEQKQGDTPATLAAALRAAAKLFDAHSNRSLETAVANIVEAAASPAAAVPAKQAKRPAKPPKPEPQASASA